MVVVFYYAVSDVLMKFYNTLIFGKKYMIVSQMAAGNL